VQKPGVLLPLFEEFLQASGRRQLLRIGLVEWVRRRELGEQEEDLRLGVVGMQGCMSALGFSPVCLARVAAIVLPVLIVRCDRLDVTFLTLGGLGGDGAGSFNRGRSGPQRFVSRLAGPLGVKLSHRDTPVKHGALPIGSSRRREHVVRLLVHHIVQ